MLLIEIGLLSFSCFPNRSKGFLGFDHGLDTVVHVLDQVSFGATEASLVGDVVGAVVRLGVFSVDTADLHVELVSNLLEAFHVLGQLGELDVHGGAQGSSQVGGARGDVTEMVVMGELAFGLDVGGSSAESVEDFNDTGSLLHGDDSKLILFVDPDEESLGIVVEDTSA